ncbi:MAG: hypothetical protein K2W82_12685 [Candidatus Obscuribacterales bacterium]|nr:hypothetical protein [Candidatus Obscuribacterales bacterium]
MTDFPASRLLKIIAGLAICLSFVFIADFFLYPFADGAPGVSGNKGTNGLWLRYFWYFGKKSAKEEEETAELLKANQIKYAYFHVLDVTAEGKLRHTKLAEGKKLVHRFHVLAPDTKVIAWVSAGDYYPAHGTDLNNPAVIRNMVDSAKWLVNDVGFDGVQWDYEPCPNNSAGLIDLLQKTRAALPVDKMLSVATPIFYPEAIPSLKIVWSKSYFGEVAKNCDQLAVMGYDSGFYTPRAYEWLMSQQLPALTKIVEQSNPKCRLMLGVPAYDRDVLHDHSETLKTALRGVRIGVENMGRNQDCFEGIALFADYTTDANEWEQYRDLWLR